MIVGVYEFAQYLNDAEASDSLLDLSSGIFLILLVLWINEDSKGYSKIYRPYEFGFLVYTYSLPYMLYYFIKTRGVAGMMVLASLLLLYNLGWVFQWAYYFAN